jgi:hypothetical protein
MRCTALDRSRVAQHPTPNTAMSLPHISQESQIAAGNLQGWPDEQGESLPLPGADREAAPNSGEEIRAGGGGC